MTPAPADQPVWPVGTRIRTLRGESAADADDVLQTVPPGTVGVITDVLTTSHGQPYYAVTFADVVSVFLDPAELADPTAYTMLDAPDLDAVAAPPQPAHPVWVAWCPLDGQLAAARNGVWVDRVARDHHDDTGHVVFLGYAVASAD